jgi:DNA polymerase-3 subunit delta'
MLDQHPHAAAVLGAALEGSPAHAYLLHGPAGSGKRDAARDFAASLLARGADDPDSARLRVQHGTHPDLTWVAPSGAHEMLRRDVDEAVVSAAARTPFEATHRVFVLERADTMNDEAANSLLKTLEEPPAYVVLLLLTDRPTQVLETVASRCQPVRFDRVAPAELARQLEAEGASADTADACARLSLGDGERARALAFGDGPELRAAAEAFARAPLQQTTGAERPWRALLERAYAAGQRARREVEAALGEELELLPKKEHRRVQNEFGERARRAERRAETGALDHALQLAGLYYRDLACLAAGVPELVFNTDREFPQPPRETALRTAQDLVDDTRARLPLNVAYELALEALAYRLEGALSSSSSA